MVHYFTHCLPAFSVPFLSHFAFPSSFLLFYQRLLNIHIIRIAAIELNCKARLFSIPPIFTSNSSSCFSSSPFLLFFLFLLYLQSLPLFLSNRISPQATPLLWIFMPPLGKEMNSVRGSIRPEIAIG